MLCSKDQKYRDKIKILKQQNESEMMWKYQKKTTGETRLNYIKISIDVFQGELWKFYVITFLVFVFEWKPKLKTFLKPSSSILNDNHTNRGGGHYYISVNSWYDWQTQRWVDMSLNTWWCCHTFLWLFENKNKKVWSEGGGSRKHV